MKYVAEIVSHITVESQNRQQAECRVNAILGRMRSLFEGEGVVFHTNSINRKHYRHLTHHFQSPSHGALRHQHLNVSRLKPGCAFAFWNKITDSLRLFRMGHAGSWTIEKWEKCGDNYNITVSHSDHDAVVKLVDASNDHESTATGYVVGMEHIAPKRDIEAIHPEDTLIGYKPREDVKS